jgi:hypothetical protein
MNRSTFLKSIFLINSIAIFDIRLLFANESNLDTSQTKDILKFLEFLQNTENFDQHKLQEYGIFFDYLIVNSNLKSYNGDINELKNKINTDKSLSSKPKPTLDDSHKFIRNTYNGEPTKKTVEKMLESIFLVGGSSKLIFDLSMCFTKGGPLWILCGFDLVGTLFGWYTFTSKNENKTIIAAKAALGNRSLQGNFNLGLNYNLNSQLGLTSEFKLNNKPDISSIPIFIGQKDKIESILTTKDAKELTQELKDFIVKSQNESTQIIKDYIDASENKKAVEMEQAQNKAQYLNSINNLVCTIIGSEIKDQQLANCINVVLSSGLKMLFYGTSPVGWVTLGIDLCTALISPPDTFKQDLFDAISKLSKQLNEIHNLVTEVYKVQISTYNLLNDLFENVINNNRVVNSQLTSIIRTLEGIQLQNNNNSIAIIKNDYETIHSALKTKYFKKPQ